MLSLLLNLQVHIILGIGDLKEGPTIPFDEQGVMSCVAASPNDPIFINHHANIDCILEKWLQENKDDLTYPSSAEIRQGHRATDYIVPFIPLYTHRDMFKTSDNFGYMCSTSNTEDEGDNSSTTRAYTLIVLTLASASVALIKHLF